MATIKYDVSDVEAGGGGEEPQPGVYDGRIVSASKRSVKADGKTPVDDLETVLDIGPEYVRLWTYIPLSKDATNRFKLREFTDALGLPPAGGFDPVKLVGKPVKVRVKAGTNRNTGEYRGEIKNLFAPGAASEANAAAAAAGAVDADETSEAFYADWTDDDLKAEMEEKGIAVAGRWARDKAVTALIEAAGGGTSDAAADGGDLPPEATEEFYAEWTDDDLKAEVAEKGIDGNISGRKSRAKYIEALIALASGPNGSDDPVASDDPPDEYDTFTDDELKEEIADRVKAGATVAVTGRWSRDKAIAALRDDDAANPDAVPF